MKFIDKYINNKLEKEGLITVPKSWTKDFQDAVGAVDSLTSDNENFRSALKTLTGSFNDLLGDYVKVAPAKDMKKHLEDIGVETPKVKEELSELYYETFKVTYITEKEERKREKPKKGGRKKKAK